MDISESLNSAAKVKNILNAFPKHRRLPSAEEFYSVKRLEEARKEVLMKCIPFLNKIGKEIKSYADGFGSRFFENIESRKNYIESKLQENKTETENQNRRARLVQEIERLERDCSHSIEKTILDEERSMWIIKYLHEQSHACANCELKDALESLVELTYDGDCLGRMESYEKIMGLL